MNIRTAFYYAAPTTIAAIISDAMMCIGDDTDLMYEDIVNVKEIVGAAWFALVANAGIEDAIEALLGVGINYNTLELLWRYHA